MLTAIEPVTEPDSADREESAPGAVTVVKRVFVIVPEPPGPTAQTSTM